MSPCRKAKGADADSKGRTAAAMSYIISKFSGVVGLLHWSVHNSHNMTANLKTV